MCSAISVVATASQGCLAPRVTGPSAQHSSAEAKKLHCIWSVATHSQAVVSVLYFPVFLAAVNGAGRLKLSKTSSGAILEGIVAIVTKITPTNN